MKLAIIESQNLVRFDSLGVGDVFLDEGVCMKIPKIKTISGTEWCSTLRFIGGIIRFELTAENHLVFPVKDATITGTKL